MVRNILDLGSTPWRLGQVARQPFSPCPADVRAADDRSAVSEWLPARVPGDVRADLLAAGRLRSLEAPEDIAASAWVDNVDWWHRAEIDAAERGTTVVLEADGIDYLSSIWLDDALLATHQGMFARQAVRLPAQLLAPGKHELAVRVWGAGALPRLPDPPLRRAVRQLLYSLNLTEEYFPDRMATPKAQFGFGWDFSPRVLSTGIWDEIRLIRCRGAYLADVYPVAEPLTQDDPTPVRWRVRLEVSRFQDLHLVAQVELRTFDGEPVPLLQHTFDLGKADSPVLTFDSPPLARWWPWDQGEPRLYRLAVRLLDEAGPVDEVETVVGVRTVRRESFANGRPWRFTINDRPVFLRGANWVPADILPGRIGPDAYGRLIGQARAAGIDYLRVWGGGIREKRAFWDQCNRLGLMVMQEFPLACAFLDHYPRAGSYLAVLESEARGIVRSLRSHPSLIAWCGGNEISPRRERLPLRIIQRVLEGEDRARPWIHASPSDGDVHQWDVWHGGAPWQSLSQVRAPFMSEFGVQALPHMETLAEMFPSGPPQSLDDPAWSDRKLQAGKLRRYAGPLPAEDLVATVVATQRTQTAALQAGIEACRLRREGSGSQHPCGGVAFWQFNEPWPAVTWSVVDRQGRPKRAYEMLSGSYQPWLVAARFSWRTWRAGDRFGAEVWLVNDTPEGLGGSAVDAVLDGQTVYTRQDVTMPPASALMIGAFEVRLDRRPSFLQLTWWRQGAAVAQNAYNLDVYLPPRQPRGAWFKRRAADLLLRV